MKLSARSEYAIKAVFELSKRYGSASPASVETIAAEQKIPYKFLVQILNHLAHAGVVRSVRGVSGGYLLARAPAQISLLEVLRAIDHSLLAESEPKSLTRSTADNALRALWGEVNEQIAATLDVTLDQFLLYAPGTAISYDI